MDTAQVDKVFLGIRLLAESWDASIASEATPDDLSKLRRSYINSLGVLLVTARKINRAAYEDAATARHDVLQNRQKVEAAQLAMQNLKYEMTRLLGEIEQCRGFRSIYQDTTIHTEEEFMQLANEEANDPEITSDPHALMLARLRFELKERQRLEEKKQALQAQQKEALRVNKQKKAELMRLEQDLKSVIAAAEPIGTSLDKFLA